MRIKGRVLMPMPTAHGGFLSPAGPRILPGDLHLPTQRYVVLSIHIDHSVREMRSPRRKGLALPNRAELVALGSGKRGHIWLERTPQR